MIEATEDAEQEEHTTWTDRWLHAAFGALIGLVVGLIAVSVFETPVLPVVLPFVLGCSLLAFRFGWRVVEWCLELGSHWH